MDSGISTFFSSQNKKKMQGLTLLDLKRSFRSEIIFQDAKNALTVNVEVLFDDELPVERLEADGADVGALLVPHDLLRQFDG